MYNLKLFQTSGLGNFAISMSESSNLIIWTRIDIILAAKNDSGSKLQAAYYF